MGSFKHEFMLKQVGIKNPTVGSLTQSIFQLPNYQYSGYYLSYFSPSPEVFGQAKFQVDLAKQSMKLQEVYRFPTEETENFKNIQEFEKQLSATLTDEDKKHLRPQLVYCSFDVESETVEKHTTSWISDIANDLYVDGGHTFERNENFRKALTTKVKNDIGTSEDLEGVFKCFKGFKPIFCFNNTEDFFTKGFFITKMSKLGEFMKDLTFEEDNRNLFIDMSKLKVAGNVLLQKSFDEENYQKEDSCFWGIQFVWKKLNSEDTEFSLIPIKFVFAPTKDPLQVLALGENLNQKA